MTVSSVNGTSIGSTNDNNVIDVDDEYNAEAVEGAKDRNQETENSGHNLYGDMVGVGSILAASSTSGIGGAASFTATSDVGVDGGTVIKIGAAVTVSSVTGTSIGSTNDNNVIDVDDEYKAEAVEVA